MKLQSMFLAAAVLVLAAPSAEASQIAVTSYDMLNGDGNTQGGTYNYWDGTYTGTGCVSCDNAPLSGGSGVLTDGFIATNAWYNVSNEAGTGQYVGWQTAYTGNPSITFNFAGSQTVTTVDVYVDNSLVGGVSAPGVLLLNGHSYAFTATPISAFAEQLQISGLDLTGSSLTLTANAGALPWVFISEVQFFDNSVPEPGTLALFGTGLVVLGALSRRRKSV